jgi:hypothetical protein
VQKGQLGTENERRIIFIWEGAVAELPENRMVRALEATDRRLGRWDQAVHHWDINSFCLQWMWSIMARTEMRMDIVVTTRVPAFGKAVARLIERNNWPVRYVTAMSAQKLGRQLPTMPDVDRVYYRRDDQRWAFGSRGVLFPDIGQIV